MRNPSRSIALFIFLGAALWLRPAVALADDDGGPLSIGGRGVAFTPRDGSTSWSGGVQARLRLPLFFGVEGSVDYRRTHEGDTTVHDWPVQLSALLYVLPKILIVQPFILGGGGWYHTTVDSANGTSDTQTRFGPHVGAGLEVTLNSHWYADATYRYIWLGKLHATNAQQVSEDVKDDGHMVTFGLNYKF